jgi:pimeloyl-ACP methyl ester carboxylesterase
MPDGRGMRMTAGRRRSRATAGSVPWVSASDGDREEQVEAGFASLPDRYAGAAPGFDATYRILLGDKPAVEVSCTEREATMRRGATKRAADVVFTTDAETWVALRRGEIAGSEAFRRGLLGVSGRLDLAIAFEGLFALEDGRPPLLRVHDVELAQGHRVSALTTGEGPDVVLIHGLGSAKSSFVDAAAILARDYRVHAIDMPGFGESSKPATAPYSAAWLAGTVRETLDALGIERAHVAGNSLGGRVAIELALRHPERVGALALLSPAVAFVGRSYPTLMRLVRPEIALLPHQFTRGMIERRFHELFADPGGLNPSLAEMVVDEFRRTYSSPGARVAFLAALRQIYLDAPFGPDGFYTRLAGLAAPSLFIWGTHDEVIRPSLRHHVAQWLPSAEQVLLEDAGHIPQVERPERVGELLRRHFATSKCAVIGETHW